MSMVHSVPDGECTDTRVRMSGSVTSQTPMPLLDRSFMLETPAKIRAQYNFDSFSWDVLVKQYRSANGVSPPTRIESGLGELWVQIREVTQATEVVPCRTAGQADQVYAQILEQVQWRGQCREP